MRTIVLIAAAVILVAASLLMVFYPQEPTVLSAAPAELTSDTEAATKTSLKVRFSETRHFLSSALNLELSCSDPDAVIYYTTDGTDPASAEYRKPITLALSAKTTAIVVKAVAVSGEKRGKVATNTFIVGGDIDERFNTLVFSLSTDPYNLYDYDYGIFVGGRLRDEYAADHPWGINPPDPANYNLRGMESERPVHVEVFDERGARVLSQNAGMRVQGGWSRANDQKSIKLIARKLYDDKGKFHYDFFPEDRVSDAFGSPIYEYNSIVLRNGGNDRDFAMLRDELTSALAAGAGYEGVSPSRAAAVFLNGEYYGFAWLRVAMDEHWLQDKYGAPDDNFEILQSPDGWVEPEDADIDNFLTYYAMEIYAGNDDWPNNNMKRWRYLGEPVEGTPLDGKWRYLMYDTDWTFGLYGDSYAKPTLSNVLGGAKNSRMLSAILENAEYRNKFVSIICSLASGPFSYDNVSAIFAQKYAESGNEIAAALASGKYANWVSEWSIGDNHANILSFGKQRFNYIGKAMADKFMLVNSMYNVNITGSALVDGIPVTRGRYYDDLTLELTPSLKIGQTFSHWIVNGKRRDGQTLVLNRADCNGDTINAEAVVADGSALKFTYAYAGDNLNGCSLTNTGDTSLKTDGLYITDDPDHLKRWELPEMNVAPGQILELVGKKHPDADALFKMPMSFNAQSGEVLILSDAQGNLLDSIIVP
ncbi:hypothetical protein FACS1894208_07380 [Clostridia bacterium]|nr:hypothetical protein FACS1894208_07380 [Clostridia bacterium]